MKQIDPNDMILLRQHRARKRLAAKKKAFGLAFYEPHEKQDLFHRAGRFKGRYVRTGNRFGKSDCGAAEDCAWLLGERVWYPPGDPARTEGLPNHPTKGLLLTQDWGKATEIFTNPQEGDRAGKLIKFLPRNHIRWQKRSGGDIERIYVKRLSGDGESVIYIDTVHSFKQDPLGAESSDWDFIHVDEPIPEKFFEAVSRGLIDRDGKYWFACTPIQEPWINDHFIPQNRLRDTFDKPLIDEEHRLWVISGSIWDNPFLTEQAINDYLRNVPEENRQAREHGVPSALSGMIFKEFDPNRHIVPIDRLPEGWKDWMTPPNDYVIRVAIDPHPKTPHAVQFCATAPTGQCFFYHEIYNQVTISALIRQIREVLQGRSPFLWVCDPAAWINDPLSGRSMADEFFSQACPIQKGSKQLDFGILKTKEALKDPNFLYFREGLVETRWEFDHYTWEPEKERPTDERDHMMENLRRLVTHGLHWINTNAPTPVIKPTDFSKRASTSLNGVAKALKITPDSQDKTIREARRAARYRP